MLGKWCVGQPLKIWFGWPSSSKSPMRFTASLMIAIGNDIYYLAPDAKDVGNVQGGWNLYRTWFSMTGLSAGAALTSDPWHLDVLKPQRRTVETIQGPAKIYSEVLGPGTARELPRIVTTIKRLWGDSAVALFWNTAEQLI